MTVLLRMKYDKKTIGCLFDWVRLHWKIILSFANEIIKKCDEQIFNFNMKKKVLHSCSRHNFSKSALLSNWMLCFALRSYIHWRKSKLRSPKEQILYFEMWPFRIARFELKLFASVDDICTVYLIAQRKLIIFKMESITFRTQTLYLFANLSVNVCCPWKLCFTPKLPFILKLWWSCQKS